LHLLKKQNATLVHHNNLRHLASTMHAGNEEYCTLSGAPEETPHKSPPPASTKVPDTHMKDDQEILQLLNFEDDIPGVECRQENAKSYLPKPDLAKNSKKRQPDATSDYISRVGALVDSLAMQYSPSRYNTNNPTNVSQPRHSITDPECLFISIPREMFAIWLFIEKLTLEEELQYNLQLQKDGRPPPIHSPTLQQPCVDWTSLNPSQHRNLPTPEKFSVQGCSQEPSFYTKTEQDYMSSYNRKVLSWEKQRHPFGSLFGFGTNMGVVAVPSQSLYGYSCCPDSGIWMIDATPTSSATSSRRTRVSRGRGGREEAATSVYT
jgi:hypothetical protein